MNSIAQEVLSLEQDQITLQMFLLTPPSLRRTNDNDVVKTITKINLQEDVISQLFQVVRTYAEGISERTVVDFYEIEKEDDQYLISLNLSDVPELQKNLKIIDEERYSRHHAHELEHFLKKLRYFVITLTNAGTTYLFVKKQSRSTLVHPKKDFYFFKDNVLTSLQNETIFTLPNTFDAVVVNGLVYISDENSFTSTFKHYEKQKEKAKEVLNAIKDLGVFENFGALEESVLNSISKFKKVSKVDPESVKNLEFDSIKQLNDAREVDLIIDPINRKVGFTTKQQMDDAIDVILENFVQSRVSPATFYSLNKLRSKKR